MNILRNTGCWIFKFIFIFEYLNLKFSWIFLSIYIGRMFFTVLPSCMPSILSRAPWIYWDCVFICWHPLLWTVQPHYSCSRLNTKLQTNTLFLIWLNCLGSELSIILINYSVLGIYFHINQRYTTTSKHWNY